MRPRIGVMCLLISLACAAPGVLASQEASVTGCEWDQAGPVTDNLQLLACTERRSYKQGETVALLVRVKNHGVGEIAIVTSSPNTMDYVFTIHSTTSWEVLPTEYFKNQKIGGVVLSASREQLDAGQELSDSIELSRLFRIETPGTYSVCVERVVPAASGSDFTRIRSNTVEFSVSESH
jgi:hypothetical protein